ncbi:NUDIX hydrolase [Kitasatospora sp. NPDC088391]|uniref:NUDIX hydrolase n=1 Tax=Kitasatospora sp. NPDC088391 TaxID=3364074 RepID=UPI00380520CE
MKNSPVTPPPAPADMPADVPAGVRPVRVLDAADLRLVETPVPVLSAEHEEGMERAWARAVAAQPSLFDGPAAVCTALEPEPDGSALRLSWARTSYRRLALRRVPGAPVVSSVFVSVVLPVEGGRIVVGRMSASTAAPGRWQLPGGNVEPPARHRALDEGELRRQAAKELSEEVGVDTDPAGLVRLAVTVGEHGNVGLHYLAPPLPEQDVLARFATLLAAEAARGRAAELAELALPASPADLAGIDGPHVDYLAPLLEHWSIRRGAPS